VADNTGDQFENNLSKLTEQVNKLATALGSVTKDSTDALTQMKKQIQFCTDELKNMEKATGGNNNSLSGLRTQITQVTQKFNEIIDSESDNGKTLGKLAAEARDTGEKIGNLLKTDQTMLKNTEDIVKNGAATNNIMKGNTQALIEAARKKKAGGKSGAEHLNTQKEDDGGNEKERREKKEGGIGKFLLGLPSMLVTTLVAITGFLFAFVKGAAQSYINFFKQMFQGIKSAAQLFIDGFAIIAYIGKSITNFALRFVGGIFTSVGALFKPVLDFLTKKIKSISAHFADFNETVIGKLASKIVKLAKGIGNFFEFIGKSIAKPFISLGQNLGKIFGPIGIKFFKFFEGLDNFVQFASKPLAGLGTKFTGFYYNIATYIEGIFTKVKGVFSLFGEVTGLSGLFKGAEKGITSFSKVFEIAGKMGAKFVGLIPLISVIPTIIETIVSAFGKFNTEGFKGVFKSIIVGLLKGIASFFTLGLSDLVLDFDKMYETISKPLDGVFDQVMGIVKIFGDVFGWIIDTLVQVYNGFLKPLVMSLWENALKPLMGALGALGDFLVKVVSLVLKLLTPVFSIVKFIFKMIFEVVKVIWDWVIWPIMKTLLPVFQVVFSVIGYLFDAMKEGFGYMSEALDLAMEGIDPFIAGITKFFDDATTSFDYLGQLVNDLLLEPVNDVLTNILGGVMSMWDAIRPYLEKIGSWLGIDVGPAPSNRGMMGIQSAAVANPAISKSESGLSPSAAMSSPSSAATSPNQIRSAAGAGGAANATVMVTNAPTTNNVVNGGGGGSSAPIILSPTPVRHADSTRAMIAC
jgi:phage-related protein